MSNGERYAQGKKAWGVCAYDGLRYLLNELVMDDYFPWLRVCKDCYNTRHPQEKMVRIIDPIALWRPAPEDPLDVAPVLSGFQSAVANLLVWTAAHMQCGRIESYALYRSVDNVTFNLLVGQDVTYEWDGAILIDPLSYADSAIVPGTVYYYYVVGLDIYNRGLRSNTVSSQAFQDQYFAEVVLLLHGNGTNGSTSIIDDSLIHNVMTPISTAHLTTANKKFGSAAMTFNGSSDFITCPVAANSPMDFMGGDFTIEGWLFAAVTVSDFRIVCDLGKTVASFGFRIYVNSGVLTVQASSISGWEDIVSTQPITVGNWIHFAVTRTGNKGAIFVNGIKTAGTLMNWTGAPTTTGKFYVGASNNSLVQETLFEGQIDDVRITKGVSRYTSNFTPPTNEYPSG